MSREKLNVCLMGASLDTGNLGVSALATSLVGLFRKHRPKAECSLFVGRRSAEDFTVRFRDKQVRVPVINYRQSFRARFEEHILSILLLAMLWRLVPSSRFRDWICRKNPRLGKIVRADLIGDIRGGDSFSDIYGVKNMLLGSIPDLIAVVLGKGLVYFPQTYGPYRNPVSRLAASFLLRRARLIISRDSEGLRVVEKMIGPVKEPGRLSYCPDVAFSLPVHRPDVGLISPPIPGDNIPLVGFNVSGLLFNKGVFDTGTFGLSFDYAAFVRDLAENFLSGRPVRILLVPHTFAPDGSQESDPDACRAVYEDLKGRFPGRIHLLTRGGSPQELKGFIGLCDFFVGSRMHACIAALSQGIPTVGVAYSRKFRGVFESAGVDDWVVDARAADPGKAVKRILDLFDGRGDAAARIKANMDGLLSTLDQTFESILAPSGSY